MSRLAIALLLLPTGIAAADTSIAIAPAPSLDRCNWEQGPYWRAWHSIGDDERRKLDIDLRAAGSRHLLVTQQIKPVEMRGSRVLDRETHAVVRVFEQFAFGLVEDRDGALVGVIEFQGGQLSLIEAAGGRRRWRVPAPAAVRSESFSTLVDGGRLILANHHRYATGASLVALDLRTGALLWSADVEQMNVAHSEYFNDVALELRGGTVVMRGYEAAGCYLQTFDAASGRRLSSQMARRW